MATMQSVQAASDKHIARRRSALENLLRILLGLWDGFDRWDDADVVAGMAARSATAVSSAVMQARRDERAFLSSLLRSFDLGSAQFPELVESYPRANVTPSEVYSRPVDEFIWRRRNGGTLTESKEAFEQRLRGIAEADMLAAEREEAQRIYDAVPQITGYRRIIHPEKAESGFSCGLCVVAASRIYSTDELLPLHGGCNCDTAPIVGGSDPGHALNENDLQEFYNAAGSTAAEDLINTRVRYVEHGELGPVLVKQGDHFRTAEEAGRPKFEPATPETRRAKVDAELTSLRAQVDQAQARYDDLVRDNPATLEPNSAAGDVRVALFRSIGYMRERITWLETRLTQPF